MKSLAILSMRIAEGYSKKPWRISEGDLGRFKTVFFFSWYMLQFNEICS